MFLVAEETREKYLKLCVPLHKAALKGDRKEVNHIIEQDPTLLTAAITKGWLTVLHVAAGANHVHLVEELVKKMEKNDLELQDYKGNTAFCFAAAAGNTEIAEIMLQKNAVLPTIRGGQGVTPIIMAVLQGKSDMALYLYPRTYEIFEDWDWSILFFISINIGIYGKYMVPNLYTSTGCRIKKIWENTNEIPRKEWYHKINPTTKHSVISSSYTCSNNMFMLLA